KRRNLSWVTNELRLLDYSIELKIITADERIRRNKLMKYFIELSKININDGENIEWPEKPD
ncbi:tail fiber assembly protein, partial [Escherichia coli]|uniref:tail fiber assembly protein n=2 Tax=Enterobacterales TaxID=91347 RepID=UPI003BFC9A4B